MFDEMLPQFHDFLLLVRNMITERRLPTRADLKRWRKELEKSKYREVVLNVYALMKRDLNAIMIIAVDSVLRERLFILIIAAERGWRLASRVAFRKKGDYADKDLAKELREEEKRKRKNEDAEKPRKKRAPYHGSYHQAPSFQHPAPSSSTHGFPSRRPGNNNNANRPETRTCINCRQVGHLLRNCPTLNSYQGAAQGAAPR